MEQKSLTRMAADAYYAPSNFLAKLILGAALLFCAWCCFADEVDESLVYKAVMKQQLLASQHAAQQQLQAATIEAVDAAKIAKLKAEVARLQAQVNGIATQTAQTVTQQFPTSQYVAPRGGYAGSVDSVRQQNVIPQSTVPLKDSLSPGEEVLTPEEMQQEQQEQQQSGATANPQCTEGDPLHLCGVSYRQLSNGTIIKVGYRPPQPPQGKLVWVNGRLYRMPPPVYVMQPPARPVYYAGYGR